MDPHNGRVPTWQLLRPLALSTALLVTVTACSTVAPGSNDSAALAGSQANGANANSPFRTFSWTMPDTRMDGSPITPDEIKGYVLIVWQVRAGENRLTPQLEGKTPSLSQFRAAGEEINQFIRPDDIDALVRSGSGNSIAIRSPQTTSYRLEQLKPGSYYTAISSVDQQDNYSALSSTVKFEVAP